MQLPTPILSRFQQNYITTAPCRAAHNNGLPIAGHVCIHVFHTYNCPLCEEAYNSRAPIADHVRMHVVNTYNWTMCAEAHTNRAPIVDHMCIIVVNTYNCTVCGHWTGPQQQGSHRSLCMLTCSPYNCTVCEEANNKWPLITS